MHELDILEKLSLMRKQFKDKWEEDPQYYIVPYLHYLKIKKCKYVPADELIKVLPGNSWQTIPQDSLVNSILMEED